MAEQYLVRFRAGTPEQRRAAIMKLGKAGDARAISVLQKIAAGEPDLALRKLANQAINHLQNLPVMPPGKTVNPATSPPVSRSAVNEADIVDADIIEDDKQPMSSPLSATSALVPVSTLPTDAIPSAATSSAATIEPSLPKPITEQRRNLAKLRLDEVITQQIAGQYKDALITLAEAVSYDPDILNTTVGTNLAVTLTDLPHDQAIAAVLAQSQVVLVKNNRNLPKIKFESGELVDTMLEAAILLIELLIVYGLSSYVKSITPTTRQPVIFPVSLRIIATESISNSLPQFIGIQVSVMAVFVAGLLLGGSSGVLRFYRFMNRTYLFSYGALAVSIILISIPGYQLSVNGRSSITSMQSAMLVGGVAIAAVTAMLSVFIQSYAVSRAHQFGYFRGCIAVIIGIVILVILVLIAGVGALSTMTSLTSQ